MNFPLSILFSACLLAGCGGGGSSDVSAGSNGGMAPGDGAPPVATKLDLVAIDTLGGTIVDEPKTDAAIRISRDDVVSYAGPIGIEFRGFTSQGYPKKSYGFETRDAQNKDLDVSLLGFPKEEDWILYGPYVDKSLMRNVLVYDLSRDIGRYASRTRFVEVAINGGYDGVYVFMEKLKRDANRIDINNLKTDENAGEDLTGGYILKLDRPDEPDNSEAVARSSFASAYAPNGATGGQQIRFLYEEPAADEITAEQRAYIKGYIDDFETALKNTSDSRAAYADFIDVDSFVDYFLLYELSNNVDAYRLSTWITKDKNGKLKMGPIWDFNLAFGNANYCAGGETDVWAFQFNQRCAETSRYLVPFWWDKLLADPAFVARVKQRWDELRSSAFAEATLMKKIDGHAETLSRAGAIDKNFSRWPVLGVRLGPNRFVGASYAEEQNYLKDWIRARLAWLDGAIGRL